MKNIVSVVISLLLSACVSAPTPQQLASADYGRNLSQQECVSIAEGFLKSKMLDPDSAKLKHSECFKSWWGGALVNTEYGYIQNGLVNGKNIYGGYVGDKHYQILIRNNSVIRYCIHTIGETCIPID